MKTLLLLPAVLFATMVNAQHYVRTKHNFGLCAEYQFMDNTVHPWSTNAISKGTAFKAGLTRSYQDIFFPEIYFTQHTGSFPANAENPVYPVTYKWNAIGAGCLMKVDLFSIDNRKRNGYCFGRVINLNLGLNYDRAVSLNENSSAFIKQSQLSAKTGLGMYSVWGGSAKRHEAWTIHWEAMWNYGLTPFMTQTNYSDGAKYAHSSFSVGMRVMHYKTYKFSDM